jgi:hypothetical protein
MQLIVKAALFGMVGIGAVAAASKLNWRPAGRPSPAVTTQAIGPAPAIAAAAETPKPIAEPASQPAQEKQAAVAKPAVQKKRKKHRRRRA